VFRGEMLCGWLNSACSWKKLLLKKVNVCVSYCYQFALCLTNYLLHKWAFVLLIFVSVGTVSQLCVSPVLVWKRCKAVLREWDCLWRSLNWKSFCVGFLIWCWKKCFTGRVGRLSLLELHWFQRRTESQIIYRFNVDNAIEWSNKWLTPFYFSSKFTIEPTVKFHFP